MQSQFFLELTTRLGALKRRYLPPTKASGVYTGAEQDQLRALRLLAHAEIEHFLESWCALLADDLEVELMSPRAGGRVTRRWARSALEACRVAIGSNNGVTDADIRRMFCHLGFSEDDFSGIHAAFLDRMKDFGRQRGDVAHKSALRATHQLNSTREQKFLEEIEGYLAGLDRLMMSRRLTLILH